MILTDTVVNMVSFLSNILVASSQETDTASDQAYVSVSIKALSVRIFWLVLDKPLYHDTVHLQHTEPTLRIVSYVRHTGKKSSLA